MSLSLLAAARESPAAVGLVNAGRSWTFAELAARVQGEIELLGRRGLRPPGGPPRCHLTAQPTPELLIRLWALIEIGVPVLLLDPRASQRERAAVRATDPSGWNLDDLPPAPPRPDLCGLCRPHPVDAATTLAVVLTSGSSGVPKGVVLSRRALIAAASASAARLGWRADDRWLLALPPAHVGGLSVITRCLLARKPVVLASPGDTAELAAALAGGGVTLASLVPAQLDRLLEAQTPPPPTLRAVLLGGGAAAPALLRRAAAAGWPVLPTYGLSEAASQVATRHPGTPPDAPVGCGPPLPGVRVRLVEGEIQVAGPTLMDGYLPPARASEPFTADGWLATGDLGRWDEAGNLWVLGRRDDMIVSGGENVAPAVVEAALLEVAGVLGALVVGIEDRRWGHLVGALLVAAGAPLDEQTLAAALAPRLGPHQRPRRVCWVAELPIGAGGKPDRAAARRLLQADRATGSGSHERGC